MTVQRYKHLYSEGLATRLSLEGYTGGQSLELAHEIDLGMESLRRAIDTAQGLQDLYNAASLIDSASLEQLALIEAGLNLAQAGTEFTADAIVPSLESFEGKQVSLEGLNARIQQIIEAIKKMLRFLTEKVGEFLESLFTDIGQLETRLHHVTFEVEDVHGKIPRVQSVALGNDVYGVSTDHGFPSDGHLLAVSLLRFVEQAKMVYGMYIPTIDHIGGNLARGLANAQLLASQPDAWLRGLNQAAAEFHLDQFKSHVGKTTNLIDSRYPMGSATAAMPLPGMRSMVFVDGQTGRDESTDEFTRAAVLQGTYVELTRANGGRAFDPSNATMLTMPTSMMEDVLGHARTILKMMAEHVSSGKRNELKSKLQDLTHAADAILAANPDQGNYVTAGLRYATTFKTWVKFQTDLLALSYSVCRSTINVCVRHLAAYETHKD